MESYFTYSITNLINGKIYIGKARNVKHRWNKHKVSARQKDPHDYSHLHKAMNKYGFDNFKVETLAQHPTESEAFLAERELIVKTKSGNRLFGYNLTVGGEGSSGYKHTEQAKTKMSISKKESSKGIRNSFYGKKHSDDTKKKFSEAASKRTGVKNSFYGKKHSEASKKQMSLNQKGKEKYFTPQDIEDIKYKKFILKIPYKKLAEEYGVYWKTISYAARGIRAYKPKEK